MRCCEKVAGVGFVVEFVSMINHLVLACHLILILPVQMFSRRQMKSGGSTSGARWGGKAGLGLRWSSVNKINHLVLDMSPANTDLAQGGKGGGVTRWDTEKGWSEIVMKFVNKMNHLILDVSSVMVALVNSDALKDAKEAESQGEIPRKGGLRLWWSKWTRWTIWFWVYHLS